MREKKNENMGDINFISVTELANLREGRDKITMKIKEEL